jgi:HSP20 family protein
VWEREWIPSLDVSETKDNFVVKAEVPGIDAKNINISLTGDVLTIRGEKKHEKEEKEEDYHLVERGYGTFSRSVRLPAEVESAQIKASYKNGILKVTLPKSAKVKAKEVKIRVE